jgi:malate synthase
MQAAALKPADFFGIDHILYLMEDMATGEIRLSILWEWIHKGAKLTEEDTETGAKAGARIDATLFRRLLEEEYKKLLNARSKDVHDGSKTTTLPISREIAEVYVLDEIKAPWFIDLLNINLNNQSLEEGKRRIGLYMSTIKKDGVRITENLDFKKK